MNDENIRRKEAVEFLDWVTANISGLQYELEELQLPFNESASYKTLADALYNGLLASYDQTFRDDDFRKK